jgi:membrane-bound metal-dependent hydrolase YbcI (DUF457 family)
MDIVTHAGIGLVAASPFLPDRPELAVGIVAGSVLPDLDVLCRLRDKMAFLRAHQTWSHALPVQLTFSAGTAFIATLLGWRGMELGMGLLAGLIGHSLLDLTNTYGVAWLTPFSRRRFCLEWVFFIDAIILISLAVALSLVVQTWFRQGLVPGIYAIAFFGFLAFYIVSKAFLRRRAGAFCPGSRSLVPSALVPWRFYGTMRQQDSISLFRFNAITGACSKFGEVPVMDEAFAPTLKQVPEFQLMREVSPEYHVVKASSENEEVLLLCRDMRMRNFGTRFGDLEVWLDSNHQVTRSRFYV